ncbi:MAG: pyridoxamine 5'-phosphate oxidase family protein [Actinomycetota bacterium]|nr:pyridoxamine 5'-phosphate oxidase family protein [Actinomycetota bacterium]
MAHFDVDVFLGRPLTARVATAGPTVRPVWYLWEDRAFWWLTGPWSRMGEHLAADPRVALVVDTCDLSSGEVRQVLAAGTAELCSYDSDRAVRKLRRYLGDQVDAWDARFDPAALRDTAQFVRLTPQRLVARDLSYEIVR